MAGAGAWTTFSSSGCGTHSNTRPAYLRELADRFEARRAIGEWIGFYNTREAALGTRRESPGRGLPWRDPPVDMMDKAQQQPQEGRFKGILAA